MNCKIMNHFFRLRIVGKISFSKFTITIIFKNSDFCTSLDLNPYFILLVSVETVRLVFQKVNTFFVSEFVLE